MTVKCKCDNCSTELEFDSDNTGEVISCPVCGAETKLNAPQPSAGRQPHEEKLTRNTTKRRSVRRGLLVAIAGLILISVGVTFRTAKPPVRERGEGSGSPKEYLLRSARNGDAQAQFKLGEAYELGQGIPKDTAEAARWYYRAANQGCADAQYRLGEMCFVTVIDLATGLPVPDATVGYAGDPVPEHPIDPATGLPSVADASANRRPMLQQDRPPGGVGEALKWFCKAADQGDADAQFELGWCYALGIGVTQRYAEAVKWYRKAAELGHAGAQRNLADCYWSGTGVAQDYAEAVKWFRRAAEQGNATAQYQLALCCKRGKGVTQDYTQAAVWFRKAANQGDAKAQNDLADCYRYGDGVVKDVTEAVNWCRKAAEQGDAEAQKELASSYLTGYGVTQDYSESVKWYRKAAERGDAEAQNELADFYKDGIMGVTQDYTEAVNWYRKAAEQGEAEAQRNLADRYRSGEGVPRDYSEAVKWYSNAATNKDNRLVEIDAVVEIARIYADGLATPDDPASAARIAQEAAEGGYSRAQYYLGTLYEAGTGVAQDDSKAFEWYLKAAKQDDADAEFKAAVAYQAGRGVPQSNLEALGWYRKAAAHGNKQAEEIVAQADAAKETIAVAVSRPARENAFFKTQRLIKGKVFQKQPGSITVECEPGGGMYANTPNYRASANFFHVEIRDVDISSVHVGDRVRFYGYEGYEVKVTTLVGEEIGRTSLTIKVPEEFRGDARLILPDNDIEWYQAHGPVPSEAAFRESVQHRQDLTR